MDERREWLEADGAGGFASGTASGIRTRRYHNLLAVATTPPTGRFALVAGIEAWIERGGRREALSTHHYAPDVSHPDGSSRLAAFSADPWPTWTFRLHDGVAVVHELFVPRETAAVVLRWRLEGGGGARLHVRPLVSGRDLHALHHENAAFRFAPEPRGAALVWRPYDGVPAVLACATGRYTHEPLWFRQFLYAEERARGLDCVEDLASPGTFTFDLGGEDATLLLASPPPSGDLERAVAEARGGVAGWARRVGAAEAKRRAAFPSRLARAADAYLVHRGAGRTVVAGYPWFTDWGRDTFIALRGLCLATGRLGEARSILLAWADQVSEGMLPNRFVEQGDAPEFNSVDAALWYVVAVRDYLAAMRAQRRRVPAADRARQTAAVQAVLEGYARGTRHGIRQDDDGLLAAGAPGLQLTWMDARIGDWVVTPRIGKPVEIQALWVNALEIGAALGRKRWDAVASRARASFAQRFWNPERRCLFDVVDVDHRPGTADPTLRPNQIYAVGGLPRPLLESERAEAVVQAVEAALLTPLGLRSLAAAEPGYRPRYECGVLERDSAYHQGTVWPFLLGAFVEAWLRVRGESPAARREARRRFLTPLLEHLDDAGLGHVSEIADAEPPNTPRGCPFQAWSVGEALRVTAILER